MLTVRQPLAASSVAAQTAGHNIECQSKTLTSLSTSICTRRRKERLENSSWPLRQSRGLSIHVAQVDQYLFYPLLQAWCAECGVVVNPAPGSLLGLSCLNAGWVGFGSQWRANWPAETRRTRTVSICHLRTHLPIQRTNMIGSCRLACPSSNCRRFQSRMKIPLRF